jgi:DNA-binding response OmpR family regulator
MPTAKNLKILLVEDHRDLAETVGDFLEAKGFTVDFAHDGQLAMHLAGSERFDAIILDIMLPGIDGIEVCTRLRKDLQLTTPILMLTARDLLDDKLTGFDAGARVDALIRRERGVTSAYTVGELQLDLDTMEASRQGQPLKLSRTLFDILRILMRESPKVVTRDAVEQELWGDDLPDSDTLRSHLYNLRQVVDKPFEQPLIETLPGRGYRIRTSASD